jgi:hypothetical protein
MACCLLGLVSFVSIAKGQTKASYLQSISNLQAIPNILVDTVAYSFELYVVNNDPIKPLEEAVSIYLSVDGDPGIKILADVMPPSPILPGDSFAVTINNHVFDRNRFTGGTGITHDIIVWPRTINTVQNDSVGKQVYFVDTTNPLSEKLGIGSLSFPQPIVAGEPYDLSFSVINKDPGKVFYQHLNLFMQVDQGAPLLIKSGFFPPLPLQFGEDVVINLDDFVFPAAAFAGGTGITHDIIVWPRKVKGSTLSDSVHFKVEYIDEAAFTISKSQVGGIPAEVDPFQNYNIQVTVKNVGSAPNEHSIQVFARLDDKQVKLIEELHDTFVQPKGQHTTPSIEFNLAELFGYSAFDSAFFSDSHKISFFAREEGGLAWEQAASFPVMILNPSLTVFSALNINSEGEELAAKPMASPKMAPSFHPNPLQNRVSVLISHPPQSPVHFELFNANYFPLKDQRWTGSGAETKMSLDLTDLKPGIYFYRISVDRDLYFGKLVKQ